MDGTAVDLDDLLDLPVDDLPKYPECPRCFRLAGERKWRDAQGRYRREIWCSFCLTIAAEHPLRGPEARGHVENLGAARLYALRPLERADIDAANGPARERRKEFMAKMAERALRERKALEAQRQPR